MRSDVDGIIEKTKSNRWHYESRVKELESFALKCETGRIKKISSMEDFFAATIVVENYNSIDKVEDQLCGENGRFDLVYRRPKNKEITHKSPSAFDFDDVRLYLKIRHNEGMPEKEIYSLVFELQIKTFLQHAWSISTHDLIYKADTIDWSSSRIAYQVKAMLEHAEISISQAESMAVKNDFLPTSEDYDNRKELLNYLIIKWDKEKLPADLTRLVDNIFNIMRSSNIKLDDLIDICNNSELIGNGPVENLSPYTAIAISVFKEHSRVMARRITQSKKGYIFMPTEAFEYIPPELRERLSKISISPK